MPEIRAAVLRGDAERLALAGGDVGAVRAGWCQHGERDGFDDRDEQGARGVGQLGDPRHRLEEPEKVGVRGDDTRDRALRIGEHRLQGGEVRGARRVAVGDQRDLVELEAALEVGRRGRPVVRVHAAADEHPLAAGRPAGHEGGLGRGRRAVVVRGGYDVEVHAAPPAVTRTRRCSGACPG